jgi:prepilin-type N-terminal cleavage/methylation domain-containing protein
MDKSKGNTLSLSKGFTIIELIIVIAIIAVLAAIVLINVTTYINKGKSAAIKGNLDIIATNSALFYTNAGGSYTGLCRDASVTNPLTAIAKILGKPMPMTNNPLTTGAGTNDGKCYNNSDAWCACAIEMPYNDAAGNNTYFCIDSTGNKKEYVANRQGTNCNYICIGAVYTDTICTPGTICACQ